MDSVGWFRPSASAPLMISSSQIVHHHHHHHHAGRRIQSREAKSEPPAGHQPTQTPWEKEKWVLIWVKTLVSYGLCGISGILFARQVCFTFPFFPVMTVYLFPLPFSNLKWSRARSKGKEGDRRLPVIRKGWAGTDPGGAHYQRGLSGGGHGDLGALLRPAADPLWPHSVYEVSTEVPNILMHSVHELSIPGASMGL